MSNNRDIMAMTFEMEEEKEFALKWLNTKKIPLVTRITYISEVYKD